MALILTMIAIGTSAMLKLQSKLSMVIVSVYNENTPCICSMSAFAIDLFLMLNYLAIDFVRIKATQVPIMTLLCLGCWVSQ